jgi:peptide/nickel transport system substrate-binding protein
MTLKRRTMVQAGLAAPALLSAATRAALAQDRRRVIRSVPIGDLRALDPIWTTAYITRNHAYMVWDTLFALDAENRVQPQMVGGYEASGDGLTWTFQLRDGLRWHDNTPVRAADCVASVRRWGQRDGMGRALMAVTDSIEARDDRTFQLKLKRAVGFVLDALGKIDSNVPFMMSERLARTDASTAITEVIGSGPFRFRREEWIPGARVVYEKFEGYVPRSEPASQAAGGKVVKVDRVESVYTPDAATASNGLLTGELDLLETVAHDLVPLLERSRDVTVAPNDPLGYQLFMVINHLHPPFNNQQARKALQMAVNQKDFMAAVVGRHTPSRECAAIFGCGAEEDDRFAALGWPARDLDKARALLREAGYDGRPVVVMDPADNAILHPAALMAADTLKQIGVTVDLIAMDWSALVQRRASRAAPNQGGWSIFVTNAMLTGVANPLLNVFTRHCDDAWFGWPCHARVPELTSAWALETDPAKRQQIRVELERFHVDYVSAIPLGQYRSVIAYRNWLKGLIPGSALFYWNIEKT